MVIQSFTEKTWDRDRYPNISWNESSCSKTQGCVVDVDFLDLIQEMRSELNFSMAFTSIYRDATHPVEDKKVAAGKRPGSHNMGCAVDIKVRGEQAKLILWYVLARSPAGIPGIGIRQKGKKRFIHLDGMNEDQCASLGLGVGWESRLWTY